LSSHKPTSSLGVGNRRTTVAALAPLGDMLSDDGAIRSDLSRAFNGSPTAWAPWPGTPVHDERNDGWAGETLLATSPAVHRWAPFAPYDPDHPRSPVTDVEAEEAQIARLFTVSERLLEILKDPGSREGLLADPWNRKVWLDAVQLIHRMAMSRRRNLVEALQRSDTTRARQARRRAAIRAAHVREPDVSNRELARRLNVSEGLVRKARRERT